MQVSFLVPTFNHELYIAEALRSIVGQTYFRENSDFEILVSDDGSSDRTCQIVESLSIPQLRLIRQQRKGVSLGMNLMMNQAQGEYLFLLSGDDRCKPDRVEQQLRDLKKHPAAICFSIPDLIDENGRSLPKKKFPVFFRELPKSQLQLFRSLYLEGNFICAPTMAMSRQLVRRLGGFRLLSWQLQDFEFVLRAIKNKVEIYISENPVVDYRVGLNGANLSASKNQGRVNLENRIIYRELFKDFDKHFIIDALNLEKDTLISEKRFYARLDLLMAQHNEQTVREAGLENIFSRFDDPSWREEYLTLGFQELDFYNFSKFEVKKASFWCRLKAKICGF